MARLPRFVLPGQPQHIIQRGNNKTPIFAQKQDYHFYLEKLAEACDRFGCEIHAYVLMTNHVHLLMTPASKDSISKTMQSLGRYYVQYFNYKYDRTGTLWEGRYKATLLDSEQYLLTCYRYIELNPVRADMVAHPSDYRWSSYHFNAQGQWDPLVSPHLLYQQLGKSFEERQSAYRQLFRYHLGDQTLTAIRTATNQAWVLGDNQFQTKVEKLMRRQAKPKLRGGDHRSSRFNKLK